VYAKVKCFLPIKQGHHFVLGPGPGPEFMSSGWAVERFELTCDGVVRKVAVMGMEVELFQDADSGPSWGAIVPSKAKEVGVDWR